VISTKAYTLKTRLSAFFNNCRQENELVPLDSPKNTLK